MPKTCDAVIEAADYLARAVREVVDSFTAPDGDFIQDDLTRVEYEQLRSALNQYREALPDDSNGGS